MSNGEQSGQLSPMKRALIELRELRAELSELQTAAREPIAVTGIGCRFPGGVVDAPSFWRLLRAGTDAIGEVPPDRWDVDAYYDADPAAAGKTYTRRGGFLGDVRGFDARFFGVSPREAASLDPQHRVLLEVAWEALEDAALLPHAVPAGGGGVFIGISNADYAHLHTRAGDATRIDTYEGLGNAFSFASGRLSHLLGWHGPSISVDTACSASLVAVHLACQSLRARECRVALAGGVNLIVNPDSFVRASKSRMLSPDGRCKTFDASADGYGRGEGAGVVVLKRLADAVADGDRILAVLRGSAINQDGHTSGLTVPNGPAQQALIRHALANAGLGAAEITYVEAHGTGTALGDPIEVGALAAVFSGGRPPGEPLLLGSVKSNIGHLESAAGIAGLIKVILALQRREIPPHLNFVTPTPHIAWNEIAIEVPTVPTPWPMGRPRLAGVSSFGFSGTNAHAIVEEPPAPEPRGTGPERPRHVLTLSGKSAEALGELVDRYVERLDADQADAVADICFTANVGRVHFSHRLAAVGTTASELRDALAAWRGGTESDAIVAGTVLPDARPEVAFLFTGQGSQYSGMGRTLYDTQPVFRRGIDRCAEVLKSELPVSLHDLLYGEATDGLDQTANTQPTLFAVEWALSELWRAWGVEPGLAIGHSLGEYVAACVAGVLDVEDALRLVAARGRLMQALPQAGAMAAVFADPGRVSAAIAGRRGVEIAALNGPANVVVSGTGEAVEALLDALGATAIRSQRLRTSHAFHSALVEPMLGEFRRIAASVAYHPARIPLLSNVTGEELVDTVTADYWTRQARQPVQFWPAMQRAFGEGWKVFLEIGPHPVLLGLGRQGSPATSGLWLPSLRRGRDDWAQMAETVATLHVHGVTVDWTGFDREYARRRVSLPTYPWQRQSHWLEQDSAPADNAAVRWQAAVGAARTQASQAPFDLDLARYPSRWGALDRLSTAYILRTLQELGLFAHASERHTVVALLKSRGIAPTYRHLMSRWLRRLAGAGWLREEPDGAFAAIHALPDPGLAEALQVAREALDDLPEVLQYVEGCGAVLAEVLTGARSPLDTLFPGGSFATAEVLYERWALSRYFSGIVRAVVTSLLAGRARRIQVVEIGAGTGGTTAAVLPALTADRATYWYTDVSTAFLSRAQRKFAAHPFVRYGLLDVERDPAAQGYTLGSFDAVVATNVLHATRDLAATIERVRSLLAPGGVLILCEATTHFSWFDVTTGLIEGWQRFEDEQRADVPLLPSGDWERHLAAAGFAAVTSVPEPGSPAEVLGQHVILARTPGDATATSVVSGGPGLKQAAAASALSPAGEAADGVVVRLQSAFPGERYEGMARFVAEQVAAVLRCRPESIDFRQPLMDVGVDSLMAVELRSRLGVGLALSQALPATLVFEHPTVEAIARVLLAQLFPEAGVEAKVIEEAVPPADGAAAIGHLSDAEVTALLMKKLESL
jgi:acyl transferase domain-containing protein/SAM-dependent methyltransferase